MRIGRRLFLAGSAAAGAAVSLTGCATTQAPVAPNAFVRREGTQLLRGGVPYRIVGANMWYAAWLGADAEYGNRPRLVRELDRLQALGINNLRVMASGEEGPLRNSIKPGFTRADGSQNPALFEGLDFVLAEMARRGMTAVLVLSNFWEWSGGLQTLLWRATGEYMDMGDPAHPWPDFPDANAGFYANPQARELYAAHLAAMVSRVNSITGVAYAQDPAIMAWQLANEPRPGGRDAVIARALPAYFDWIEASAAAIRAIDPNHLVSLGHEGTMGANGSEQIVLDAHQAVDYLTAHIWPLNWSWVIGADLPGTWPLGRQNTLDYLAAHERLANVLVKPLVIEEFGFPRDREGYSPDTTTEFRQRFYEVVYDAVEASWRERGPIMGSNFWAWNGEARTPHADARFREGDLAYMGDPPHEPQGWYGNFDSDAGMLALIEQHAENRCLGMGATCPY